MKTFVANYMQFAQNFRKGIVEMSNSLYQTFYETFQEAILKNVKPSTFLTLTGGWDTRVIAGILSVNNVHLPAISWGSKLENTIASKIASELGLSHYCCSSNQKYSILRYMRLCGCEYLLSGLLFDEINGSWTGNKAKTKTQFEYAKNLGLKTRLQDLARYHNQNQYPELIMPIFDDNVLKVLESIPWQLRKGKQLQRWILKTKFPRLWHIPYYNSFLPNCLPYPMHGISAILHLNLKDWVRHKLKLDA
jgi:hypothetical protein